MDKQFLGEGKSGATFSDDRVYRYCLWRRWRLRTWSDDFGENAKEYPDNKDVVAFIGLNPSTADETEDDPTIRRCIGFAKSWGLGGIAMINLFAFRATNPKDMKNSDDPIGPLNFKAVTNVAWVCKYVVCCWGNHGEWMLQGGNILMRIRNCVPEGNIYHLGLTKSVEPKHPLYLKADTKKQIFTPQGE